MYVIPLKKGKTSLFTVIPASSPTRDKNYTDRCNVFNAEGRNHSAPLTGTSKICINALLELSHSFFLLLASVNAVHHLTYVLQEWSRCGEDSKIRRFIKIQVE